jgi:hypothetical protein
VQLLRTSGQLELYVARQGRFNLEAYVGFGVLESSLDGRLLPPLPSLAGFEAVPFPNLHSEIAAELCSADPSTMLRAGFGAPPSCMSWF